jgi:hypothetical protein
VHEERVATESVSETHHAAVDEAIAEAMEHAEGAPRADGDSDTNAPGLDVPTTPHIANPVDSAE